MTTVGPESPPVKALVDTINHIGYARSAAEIAFFVVLAVVARRCIQPRAATAT